MPYYQEHFPPPNLSTPLQAQYFKNLQWKNKIRSTGAPETIKIKDIKKGYKKWKGITGTSPSNRHLGYNKSLLAVDGTSKKDQTITTSDTI